MARKPRIFVRLVLNILCLLCEVLSSYSRKYIFFLFGFF
uniref:Uncharacterized protein n=1 Tax=Anguilla anguilla TaxID=7936 RepID=A0A0E9WEK0_ANGAN